jgi:hypothetical protein
LTAVGLVLAASACGSGGGSSAGTATTAATAPAATAPLHSQVELITAAAKGKLSGPGGTVTFNPDGTYAAAFSSCGTSSTSTQPFGVDCSGHDTPTSGKFDVRGPNTLRLFNGDGSSSDYGAYVDGAGKLHIGAGTTGALAPDKTGDISLAGASSVVIQVRSGPTCAYIDTFSNDTTPHPTPCQFGQQNGVATFTATVPDEFTKGLTKTLTLVYEPAAGLLVDPVIWFSVFTAA